MLQVAEIEAGRRRAVEDLATARAELEIFKEAQQKTEWKVCLKSKFKISHRITLLQNYFSVSLLCNYSSCSAS